MDTSKEKIYLHLDSVFSLSKLFESSRSQSITIGSKTITYVPNEVNEFFHLGIFLEQDHQKDIHIYNEITVRIWCNKKAEAYILRQGQYGYYQEAYIKREGVEYPRPDIRAETNQFLFDWLTNLQKEHGTLQLQ